MSFLFSLIDSPYFWPVVLVGGAVFAYHKFGDRLSIRMPGGSGLSLEGVVGRLLALQGEVACQAARKGHGTLRARAKQGP
jgi:hypothetical protein